jgi:hypothetical protein
MRIFFCFLFVVLFYLSSNAQSFFADSVTLVMLDSTKKETEKYLKKGSERIGRNGFALHGLYINQAVSDGTNDSRNTVGLGISGDVLTGVPYIHLMPIMKYWNYSSTKFLGDSARRTLFITDHEMSFHFNAAFITGRFTNEALRVFGGVGPSMHIDIQSVYEIVNTVKFGETTPGVRNGLGAFAGIEWPFSVYATLLFTGSYVRTYDWNLLDKILFSLSIGLAI